MEPLLIMNKSHGYGMNYGELLQTDEWEAKRYDILQRDNYLCQDCGCKGVNNNIFFPISKISDLKNILPNILLTNNIEFFCDSINWDGRLMKSPIYYQVKNINDKLYIYTINVHKRLELPFLFAADVDISNIHFKEINIDNICLSYRDGQVISGGLFAFLFKEDLGETNYAAINYSYISNNLEKLELNILFKNKYFYFSFLHYCHNERALFSFIPLNIHHNYYIYAKRPWEYDDDALVTLCSSCHQKRHSQINIPLYTLDRQLMTLALPVCSRCQGTGYLPQYHYYMRGICFECYGEGVRGF